MALSSNAVTGAVSFDITANTMQLDLSRELAELIRTDNAVFISRLGNPGLTASQVTHYWNEDGLTPNTATLTGDLDASTGSCAVANATEYARFKIGTIFKFNEKGKTEVCRVTAVGGTPTLTIERGHGTTDGETHTSGATILIIAHTRQEDQNMDEDDTLERSSQSNYLQIFQRGVRISYTREKIDTASGGVVSEFAHQVAYRTKEEMRSLDNAVINSVKSASAGSASDYRSMGGLIEWVSQSGANKTTTAANLSETVVNDMAEQIVGDAGIVENGFILCSPKLRRVISTFDEAYRRGSFDGTRAGFYVERFLTDMGFQLEVIQDPWVPDDTLIVGDLNRVKVVALQSDQMRFEELAKLGRSYRGQITGQYGLEVRNAKEAFAIHTNLA